MGYASIALCGNVTGEPRFRDVQTRNGARTVMSFNVATDHGYGDRRESTFWTCEHWVPESEKAANFLAHAIAKGARVTVFGEPYRRTYTGNDGVERTVFQVDASRVEVQRNAPDEVPQDAPRPSAPQPGQQVVAGVLYDEDIPF